MMKPKPKPWQRHTPRPYRREVMILDTPPLAQIDVYPQCTILTRRRFDGRWSSYPVDPDDLTALFSQQPQRSGLLPWGTLAYGRFRGMPYLVQYLPAQRATVQISENGAIRSQTIPLPPLLWAGWERDYRVWALTTLPDALTPQTRLFHAPLPNVHGHGAICWGSVRTLKPADAGSMGTTWTLFLTESAFSSHLANGKSHRFSGNILRLYDELDPEQPYPLDDLIPHGSWLSTVVDGHVWGQR